MRQPGSSATLGGWGGCSHTGASLSFLSALRTLFQALRATATDLCRREILCNGATALLLRHVHKPCSQLLFDISVYLLVTVDRVNRPFVRCTYRFTPPQRMHIRHWQLACTMATRGGGGARAALTYLKLRAAPSPFAWARLYSLAIGAFRALRRRLRACWNHLAGGSRDAAQYWRLCQLRRPRGAAASGARFSPLRPSSGSGE